MQGCTNHENVVIDAGLTTTAEGCSPDSSTYVGFLDLSRTELEEPFPSPHPGILLGVDSRFFRNGPPYSAAPLTGGVTVFCAGDPAVGQCCTGPFPPDGDAGAGGAQQVGVEYVTCLDEQTGDANGSVSMSDPNGGVTCSAWSNGDSLQCSADGGVAGSFTTSISTPLDFTGLSPDLFSLDGGPVTISRTQDLLITWTAGSSSSAVSINLFGSTSAVACSVADTGSFTVPGVLLNQFSPQEQGFLALHRYISECVQTPSAQVSVLVENGLVQSVVYQ